MGQYLRPPTCTRDTTRRRRHDLAAARVRRRSAPTCSRAQEARIADPLWLLGKQWQVGELTGEDAASPILVEAAVEHAPVTRVPARARPTAAGPSSSAAPGCRWRRRSSASRCATGRPPPGSPPRRGSSCGGCSTRAARPGRARPALRGASRWRCRRRRPRPGRARRARAARAARSLRRARGARRPRERRRGWRVRGSPRGQRAAARVRRVGAPGTTSCSASPPRAPRPWDPQRMEYSFQVAAGVGDEREVQLEARGVHRRPPRLVQLRRRRPAALPMGACGALEPHELRVVPTPVRFAGQAASRWWQVENADVWFGDINTAPEDLARVAVAAYGAVFGDDWFLRPLPAARPACSPAAREVTVLDTFGERHAIRSCAERDGAARVWRFFELDRRHLGRRRRPVADRAAARGCSCRRCSPGGRRAARSRRSRCCATRRPTSAGPPSCGSRAPPGAPSTAPPWRAPRCRRRPAPPATRGATGSRRPCPTTASRSSRCAARRRRL